MAKVIKTCVILCCVYFVFSCSDSYENIPVQGEGSQIQLFIPGASEVQVYSTATARENYIEDCFVVVFRGGSYYMTEKIDVSDIIANGEASALLPQLTTFKIEDGDRVYVICNTGLATVPAGITAESDINGKFPPAKAYYFSGEALPMSGSTTWSSSSSTTVILTRAVAKVQVRLGESFSMEGFDFAADMVWDMNVFLENINLCGFVVCNYAGKSDILQPSAPALSQTKSDSTGFYGTYEKFIRLMQYATADSMAIYVSEYPNSTIDCEGNTINDDVFNEKRQYLLMMDRVVNNRPPGIAGAIVGFWRLDFYDAASKKYLDIKRNHTYTFTINKIRSTPYLNEPAGRSLSSIFTVEPFEAVGMNLPGSNIEYTMEVEDDWANVIYSNGQYALLLSADTINDGNVDLPFYLKAHIPAGFDKDLIRMRIAIVRDREGWAGGLASTALELSINGTPVTVTYTMAINTPMFHADGTINTLRFNFDDLHPRAQYYDNANMYIYMGNIQRKVPIKLTP
jgi:hypothetical protein